MAEIEEECSKYGKVENVIVWQEGQSDDADAEIHVKIFVEFAKSEQVKQAKNALDRRCFRGRTMTAFVYDEELYDHQRCGVEQGLIRHQGAELRNTEESHSEDMSNMSVPEATINITDKDRPVVNHDLTLAKTTKVDEHVNKEPPTDLAWSLGCLIWKIFNQTHTILNYKDLTNIPDHLVSFYKSCLKTNPLKRPALSKLADFLMSCKSLSQSQDHPGGVDQEQSIAVAKLSHDQPDFVEEDMTGDGDLENTADVAISVGVDDRETAAVVDDRWTTAEVGGEGGDGDGGEGEGKKRFVCPVCGRGYGRNTHLRRHVRAEHKTELDAMRPKQDYKCDFCSKSYSMKHHLQRHVQNNHVISTVQVKSCKVKRIRAPKASLSPYELIRERNIKDKIKFLEALNVSNEIMCEILYNIK